MYEVGVGTEFIADHGEYHGHKITVVDDDLILALLHAPTLETWWIVQCECGLRWSTTGAWIKGRFDTQEAR